MIIRLSQRVGKSGLTIRGFLKGGSLLVFLLAVSLGGGTAQTTLPECRSSISLPCKLEDSEKFVWDIQNDGSIREGSNDAFDGGLKLSVDRTPFPAFTTPSNKVVLEAAGREVVIGPADLAGLQVWRRIFVPKDDAFARFVEVFKNLSQTDTVTVTVRLDTDLGSGLSTVIVWTCSGDVTFDPADNCIVTDDGGVDGSGSPAIAHVIAGPERIKISGLPISPLVRPAKTKLDSDKISYTYNLQIKPEEVQVVMHFASQQKTRKEAMDIAKELEGLGGNNTSSLRGFDKVYTMGKRVRLVNFRLRPPNPFIFWTKTPILAGDVRGNEEEFIHLQKVSGNLEICIYFALPEAPEPTRVNRLTVELLKPGQFPGEGKPLTDIRDGPTPWKGCFILETNPISTPDGPYLLQAKIISSIRSDTSERAIEIKNRAEALQAADGSTEQLSAVASRSITGSIPIRGDVKGMAISINPRRLYAISIIPTDEALFHVVDLETSKVILRTADLLPIFSRPTAISLSSWDGRRAYITKLRSNDVSVIDLANNQLITTIGVREGPTDIAITWDSKRAYVTNSKDNSVSVIDLDTHRVIATIPVIGSAPTSIDIVGPKAFVVNRQSDTIDVIDINENTIIAVIPTGRAPSDIACLPNGRKCYVVNREGGVGVIDVQTHSLIRTIPQIPAGFEYIAAAPDSSRLYLSHSSKSRLRTIDTATDLVLDKLELPGIPQSGPIVADPRLENIGIIYWALKGKDISRVNAIVAEVRPQANFEDDECAPLKRGKYVRDWGSFYEPRKPWSTDDSCTLDRQDPSERGNVIRLRYKVPDTPDVQRTDIYTGFWLHWQKELGDLSNKVLAVWLRGGGPEEGGHTTRLKLELKSRHKGWGWRVYFLDDVTDKWNLFQIPLGGKKWERIGVWPPSSEPDKPDEFVVTFDNSLVSDKEGVIYLDAISLVKQPYSQ